MGMPVSDPINVIAKRVWSRLCREARRGNQHYTINQDRWTPESVDPDTAAMIKFIMTFYPEDRLEPFDD